MFLFCFDQNFGPSKFDFASENDQTSEDGMFSKSCQIKKSAKKHFLGKKLHIYFLENDQKQGISKLSQRGKFAFEPVFFFM